MSELNIQDKLNAAKIRIPKLEHILAKGLNQPFNHMNSSSRKLMFASQIDQILPLSEPEPPLLSTGYENEYGRRISAFRTANDDYEIMYKIPKFIDHPDKNYIIISRSLTNGKYTCSEVKEYYHTTEAYGFLMNNNYLNKKNPGDVIHNNDVVQKSQAFDKYNNRQDGINLVSAYMSLNKSTDDAIIIAESAAEKMSSPLIHKVQIVINDNDIPLNLYGDEFIYKTFPELGEPVKNGLLMATRRRKTEDILYTESIPMLRDILSSDEKFPAEGTVMDIDIYCNNPDVSRIYQNSQLNKYYQQSLDFSRRIMAIIGPIYKEDPDLCSDELKDLYLYHSRILDDKKFKKEKAFSHIIIDIYLLKIDKLSVGDKLTDRFGGKGVISEIRPDHMMPLLSNGQQVEIIFNLLGCVNRENPGQLAECSLNFIARRHLDYYDTVFHHIDECEELYLKFIRLVVPDQYVYLSQKMREYSDDEKLMYFDEVMKYGGIHIAVEPMSDVMSLDKIDLIYKAFPWIEPYDVIVPIESSTGDIRYIQTRRKMYIGSKYIYRLKQYAEDKFSATSLSATNIKNQPDKSKMSKNYKAPYSKTPIRFGEMETGDMYHLNPEVVVKNLMLHSASPHGRRQTEKLFTDNPFDVNVELDDEASNRNVEILNAYLKTMGLKLVFTKRKKHWSDAIVVDAVEFITNPNKEDEWAIEFVKRDFMWDAIENVDPEESAIEFIALTFGHQ